MNRNIVFLILILVSGLFLAVGCKGPAGPAGTDGESKILQLEGFAANIKCGDCHNPDIDTTNFVWAKKYQWELSKHFFGGDFERNATPCAGCHTTEGFIQRAKANFPAQPWTVVTTQKDPSPPGCFACHSPHSRANFTRRTEAALTLWSPMDGVADQTINLGKGNICLSCHQPRAGFSPKMPKTPAATDTLTITSSRWFPHYGVQGLMFKGVGFGGGFEFSGKTYANSPHPGLTVIQQEGCITCHMAPSNAGSGIGGGHTMNVNYLNTSGIPAWNTNGCLTSGCHSTMASVDDYVSTSSLLTGGVGARKFVLAYTDTLKALLVSKKYLDATGGLVMGRNGTSTASSSNPAKIPSIKAGALYNYFFIKNDRSGGIHNSRYAIQLLLDSIEELKKP